MKRHCVQTSVVANERDNPLKLALDASTLFTAPVGISSNRYPVYDILMTMQTVGNVT